jgi:hypothetical protein
VEALTIDLESLDKWDYTTADEAMIRRTDTEWAPWTMVKSNDKRRARLNAMRAFLCRFDHDGKDHQFVGSRTRRSSRHRRRRRLDGNVPHRGTGSAVGY